MANEKRMIDANALMKRFYNYYDCVNEFTGKNGYRGDTLMDYEVADMIYDCIDNAPTVDAVEVLNGRWEDKENPQWRAYDIRHCSICGWNIPKNNLRKKDLHWNYCPNCGAKMDGGNEDA